MTIEGHRLGYATYVSPFTTRAPLPGGTPPPGGGYVPPGSDDSEAFQVKPWMVGVGAVGALALAYYLTRR